ncbi:Nif3-like dinuclear metal center hexameric protein, partial [Paenarthrobacter sp. RAF9]
MEPENTDVSAQPDEATRTGEAATLGMILLAVEELWPESLAEEWDEVGLVAGHPSAEVSRILFAVDPTLEVIEEAVAWGAEL